MSRSGYTDDYCDDPLSFGRWRGAVANAIRGKRGQAFLKEMLEALDALQNKSLASEILVEEGECCAMGAVAIKRGLDVSELDPEEPDDVAGVFGISHCLAAEIAFMNDEGLGLWMPGDHGLTQDEIRFVKVREWVAAQIGKGGGSDV